MKGKRAACKTFCFSLLLIVALPGCRGGHHSETSRQPLAVRTQTVQSLPLTTTLAYSGTIEASAMIELSPSMPGTIERVLVRAGRPVRRGQLLAVVNPESCRDALDLARAKLEQAEDARKRFEPMHKNSSMPDIKMVEIETGVRQARAAVSIAEKNLRDCQILAPTDGVIGRRAIEAGMNVLPGIPAFTLLQLDSLLVKIAVPENEIAMLKADLEAQIVVGAISETPCQGRVTEIGVLANPLSRSYEVKITLDKPDSRIRPGMVCNVSIPLPTAQTRITIERSALQVDETGKRFVFVVDPRGIAAKRPVQTGRLVQDRIAVEEGLQDGELVVVSGTHKIHDGDTVRII